MNTKPSVAILSASFGGIDDFKTHAPQVGVNAQVFQYNEKNTPSPFPNLPPRLQAKWFKCQGWLLPELQHFDFIIWVDASIEITSPFFATDMIKQSQLEDIAFGPHPQRENLLQEMAYIEEKLSEGDPYIKARFDGQPLEDYKQHIFKNLSSIDLDFHPLLYAGGVFIYKNDDVAWAFLDIWWTEILMWTWHDQIELAWVIFNHELELEQLNYGNLFDNTYFKVHQHKNMLQ